MRKTIAQLEKDLKAAMDVIAAQKEENNKQDNILYAIKEILWDRSAYNHKFIDIPQEVLNMRDRNKIERGGDAQRILDYRIENDRLFRLVRFNAGDTTAFTAGEVIGMDHHGKDNFFER